MPYILQARDPIIFVSWLASFIPLIITFAIWRAFRNDWPLAALPWLMIASLLKIISKAFLLPAVLLKAIPDGVGYWIYLFCMFSVAIVAGLSNLTLIASNACVILSSKSTHQTRVTRFFSACYPFRHILGLLLLTAPLLNIALYLFAKLFLD